MLRFLLGLIGCAFLTSSTLGANFWLSSSPVAVSPPTTLAEVPTITRPPSTTQGTFYIWARPTAGKTLENWSLDLESSNPGIVSFTSSSVEAFNPDLGNNGGLVRWEVVAEPMGSDLFQNGIHGLNIFGAARTGKGIGPQTKANDPLYYPSADGWLLASVTYSIDGTLGDSSIYLRIGTIGMNHAEDVDDTSGSRSSKTNVVFGWTEDDPLNAEDDRVKLNSLGNPLPGIGRSDTHDLLIRVVPPRPGDFDNDGDVDGRDFLNWQKGISSNGNPGVSVSAVDLADWRANYGTSGLAAATAVPEPSAAFLIFASGLAFCGRPFSRRVKP